MIAARLKVSKKKGPPKRRKGDPSWPTIALAKTDPDRRCYECGEPEDSPEDCIECGPKPAKKRPRAKKGL